MSHRVCSRRATWTGNAQLYLIVLLLKGDDGTPHLTWYDHVYFPRAMMECHTRHRWFICVVQEGWWHSMPDIIRPCVITKGDNGMPRLTSFVYVCSPRAMIMCHAQHRLTVCVAKEIWWHEKLNVVRPCVLSNGNYGIPRPTSSIYVCNLRALKSFHTRHCPILCLIQGT